MNVKNCAVGNTERFSELDLQSAVTMSIALVSLVFKELVMKVPC